MYVDFYRIRKSMNNYPFALCSDGFSYPLGFVLIGVVGFPIGFGGCWSWIVVSKMCQFVHKSFGGLCNFVATIILINVYLPFSKKVNNYLINHNVNLYYMTSDQNEILLYLNDWKIYVEIQISFFESIVLLARHTI